MRNKMPTSLIGIQDWYIECLHRNNYCGWKLFRSRAFKSLRAIGFTFQQATIAMQDAFDMYELERICLDASV